jgi:hypothetical protein
VSTNRGITMRQGVVTQVLTSTVKVDPYGDATEVEVDLLGLMPALNDVIWIIELGHGGWLGINIPDTAGDGGGGIGALTFSPSGFGGNVVVTDQSSPGWFPGGATVLHLEVRMNTAGSTSTVVTFYKNGISFQTVTLLSGETAKEVAVNVAFANNDELTCRVTTAGTGAKGLTAYAKTT